MIIDDDVINYLFSAAQWSQSAHNMQPWRFILIKDKKTISRLADILNRQSRKGHVGFNVLLREASKNVMQAPIVIAVYNTKEISRRFGFLGKNYKRLCTIFEIQSISASIQNLSLAAAEKKVGLAWIGIALFCESAINRLLNEAGSLMALLTLGYPNEFPKRTNRKPLAAILTEKQI